MQRRAAAAYVALFIVIAAGSYAFTGAAEEPTISLENPDVSAASGDDFEVDGVQYTVADVNRSEGGGGLEGGGEGGMAANLTWSDEVRQTETLESGDVVEVQDANWTVEIDDGGDPSSFRLVENHTIDRPTVTEDNVTYVVVEQDGERDLVEREEYVRQQFGEPETHEFTEGDAYLNETKTVDNVTADAVTLGWNVTQEQRMEVSEGDKVVLQGTTYVVHFPDESTVLMTTDVDAYQDGLDEQERFQQRIDGINYVGTISLLAAILLIAASYMPRRR
ncbi:hypothetical protein BRC81_16210 [Halobacteriales archaeon QS_1_68_20]|nr:MAG: hypothetical protein BRC81_16210 [Halobacteriales archaeon QS_1_68_20]